MVCTFSAFVASLCGSPQNPWFMADVYSALWTSIATAIAFVATLALLIAHLFHLVDTFHAVPWNTIEIMCSLFEVHCMLFSGAIMMAFADALTNRRICALFCWAAAIAYGRDAFLFLRDTRHTPDRFMESSIHPKDMGETTGENARVISSKCEPTGS
ncbi:uncharacterized protein LOC129594045 [Paramacrobiotus metropolitanus]|uniref:uncharacterized protein LOC129594045 n=1 Tax=Paramacrobiotus metropolitanus TaxID=2943436 RepID=UPI0024463AD8|nr:uncharacterized protein LOC129594045 [Paramacrobiotus metropolitanus]